MTPRCRKRRHLRMEEPAVEIVTVSVEEGEEVLASDVSSAELDELREWFCYTKPIGRGMNIIARSTSGGESGFHVRATGTDPGPSDEGSLMVSCSHERA